MMTDSNNSFSAASRPTDPTGEAAAAKEEISLWLAIGILASLIGVFIVGGLIIKSTYFSTPTPRSELERDLIRFRAQVAQEPNSAFARVNLGRTYYRLGQTNRALTELKIARKLDPKLWDAPFELGVIYLNNKNTAGATKFFLQAKRADPRNELSYYQLGIIYLAQKKYDLAIANLERTVELKPILADAHYNLGKAYEGRKSNDEALTHYREALKYVPDMTAAQEGIKRLSPEKQL